jgi:hypothetical protein
MPTHVCLSYLLPCFVVVDIDHIVSHPALCLLHALIAQKNYYQVHHEQSHSQLTRETHSRIFNLNMQVQHDKMSRCRHTAGSSFKLNVYLELSPVVIHKHINSIKADACEMAFVDEVSH